MLISAGLLLGINGQTNPQEHVYHPIKKGETVSLICIQYYGYYSQELGEAVKQINTSIKDINVIVTGSKLKLAKPSDPAGKKEKPATVFEKKIKITQGVVTCVEGTAFITKKGVKERKPLAVNTLVYPGDILQT
ncbi:MAG: hypothetical protein L0Y76_13065, partial [Ignavibacteria bacterium]|nr:hypothetical protein [Ignavibacteria bacterium]